LKFPLDALHETAYIAQMPNDTTGNVPQGRPVEVAQKAGCGATQHSEGDCGADAEVSASLGSQSAWMLISRSLPERGQRIVTPWWHHYSSTSLLVICLSESIPNLLFEVIYLCIIVARLPICVCRDLFKLVRRN
jgi:hypothetical protein